MAIIITIIMFMILVIIHEGGHFLAAKKAGVKVYEFGIGIPPKLFKFYTDKSGTEYTINAIPLGGFVRLKGEDPEDEEAFNSKDSFITQRLSKKLIILLAGVFTNFVFAFFIFFIVFWIGIKPIFIIPENALPIKNESLIFASQSYLIEKGFLTGSEHGSPIIVENIMSGAISQTNVQTGDILLKVNNIDIDTNNISNVLKENIAKQISLEYDRNGEIFVENIQCPIDNCVLGISYGRLEYPNIKLGFMGAIGAAGVEIKSQVQLTFYVLGKLGGDLFSFNQKRIKGSVDKLVGPVGITKMGESIRGIGFWEYVAFAGMISLALAIFNILPIPALDGGRALGNIIQIVFKFKAEKYFAIENYFNVAFFLILMALGIYIILKDLNRFYNFNIPGVG